MKCDSLNDTPRVQVHVLHFTSFNSFALVICLPVNDDDDDDNDDSDVNDGDDSDDDNDDSDVNDGDDSDHILPVVVSQNNSSYALQLLCMKVPSMERSVDVCMYVMNR